MAEDSGNAPVAAAPSAWSPLQNSVFRGLWIAAIAEYRHVDAGRRRRLADDVADVVSVDGCSRRSGRQHPGDAARDAGRGARRHRRSPPPAHRHPVVSDDHSRRVGNDDAVRSHHRMGAARLYVLVGHRWRADDAGVVGDRPGRRRSRRVTVGDRAEQHCGEHLARDRARDCRPAGCRCVGATARTSGSCSTTPKIHRDTSSASWTNRGSNTCASTNALALPIETFSSVRSNSWSKVNRRCRHTGSPIGSLELARRGPSQGNNRMQSVPTTASSPSVIGYP